MNWDELLQACPTGLPYVESIVMVDGILHRRGKVTNVKDDSNYKGCAVRWDAMSWDTWYYADPGTDRRMRYMNQVKISEDQTTEITWQKKPKF